MQRSLSKSLESITQVGTTSLSLNIPDCDNNASTRVLMVADLSEERGNYVSSLYPDIEFSTTVERVSPIIKLRIILPSNNEIF